MADVTATPPRSENSLTETCASVIRKRLPESWPMTVTLRPAVFRTGRQVIEVDAEAVLRAPNGQEVTLIVEVKLSEIRTVDVLRVAEQLSRTMREYYAGGRHQSPTIPVLFARYLPKPTRDMLAKVGLGYVDATGNILLRCDDPPLFLSDRGADHDPWRSRSGRPQRGLDGEPSAKVVRALADLRGPWKIRDLVQASGASTGAVYRVLDFLEGEGLVVGREDGGRGPIDVPDWQALLRLWSKDYQFFRANEISRWIAPRGLSSLMLRMRTTLELDYALTGSIAAELWAPHAPVKSAMVYASDPVAAAKLWQLRPTETGANVLLAQPAYAVSLERKESARSGLKYAAPTQVAVDLMTGPGRAPAEAEELLEWMGRHERDWRGPR
ncbi:helix-turn-helix domain-containing protein [Nocardia fluminea]|uniref:helix-turn-helix domain-containing protein n=1 Tax=Nocardia fluminea TaxID=134984 RepID=UPI003405498A